LIRAALDTRGLRIVGNLTTHNLPWQEITLITKRRNHASRAIMSASRSMARACRADTGANLWFAGYSIDPGMEKGGSARSAYLKRKRRECLKRQQTADQTAAQTAAQTAEAE